MYSTHRRWWTVADAARLLRVHTDTLYDACASGGFPHERWDGTIRIPCEALRMTYVATPEVLANQRRYAAFTQALGDIDQLARRLRSIQPAGPRDPPISLVAMSLPAHLLSRSPVESESRNGCERSSQAVTTSYAGGPAEVGPSPSPRPGRRRRSRRALAR